jgi:rare lipoprotein A (peptidoglycan hydrolase)
MSRSTNVCLPRFTGAGMDSMLDARSVRLRGGRGSRRSSLTASRFRAHIAHRRHYHAPLREAIASWYGPADSGGNLACGGGALTSSTLGVANKTLPCNTRVRVCGSPKGPCVNVSVVDRGPYITGREFDLTEATARQIGFLSVGVGTIWVSVR